jgi:hypothetical protein
LWSGVADEGQGMIEWCFVRFGICEAEFVRFLVDVSRLVEMKHPILVSDIKAEEGRDDVVVFEFETTVEILDTFGVVFGFSIMRRSSTYTTIRIRLSTE